MPHPLCFFFFATKNRVDSKEGVNPLEGFTPSKPKGSAFEIGTPEFKTTEKIGIRELGSVGFVLVAGGLGERLGYSGAKIGLPTETTTGTSYLQYYCEYIKAVQTKCAKGRGTRLPLCIMVSSDTKTSTIKLLKENKYFGLRKRQIFLVEQGDGVPALSNNDAKIALDEQDPFKVVTKPHGHGDIHALLYKEGITKIFKEKFNLKYLVIFQDTNALAFHTLPLMLGVSENEGFIMNSLTVPRKAKQAIGGIAKLTNKKGIQRYVTENSRIDCRMVVMRINKITTSLMRIEYPSYPLKIGFSEQDSFYGQPQILGRIFIVILSLFNSHTFSSTANQCRTINVEYNHLDPLLRNSKEFKEGDVNDKTGFSPFPGNINQLLFNLDKYHKILERTKGVMPDVVNPKYADDTKAEFKTPTRLECMMQDFPTVLEKDESKKVGFTQVDAALCFSPVKNSVADGIAFQSKGIAAGTAANGEADQFAATRMMLRARGCQVEDAAEVDYGGIKVVPGPAIVFKPNFVCCPGEYNVKFPYPEKVKISSRSTLVIRGPGVTIESLDLDGALIIDVDPTEKAIVRDLVVKNDGWVQVPEPESADEKIAMRGYGMDRKDARHIEVKSMNAIIEDDISEDGTEYVVEDRIACGGMELGRSFDHDEVVAVKGAKGGVKSVCTIM